MNDLIVNIHESCQNIFKSTSAVLELDIQKLESMKNKWGPSQLKTFAVEHYDYYEHYKVLILSLGLKISKAQKIKRSHYVLGKKLEQDQSGLEKKAFYELLITSYAMHRCYENLYVLYLNSHYDQIFERLYANGLSLYLYLTINFPDKIKDQIEQAFGRPVALDPKYSQANIKYIHPFSVVYFFDKYMPKFNLWRLLLGRIRRFYLSLQAFLQSLLLSQCLGFIEPFFSQFMAWVNFLYFLPRFFLDLSNFIYHVFLLGPHSEEEASLSFMERVRIHFNRRWESTLRDLFWLTNSFLSLFILTGSFGIASLYVNAFMQLLETGVNLYLIYFSENREEKILDMVNHLNTSFETKEIRTLFKELNYRWSIDERIREIRFYNSLGVLLSFILILPCMASISPIIPLIGATLGLIMSHIQFNSFSKFNFMRGKMSDPITPAKTSKPVLIPTCNSQGIMTSN